MVSKPGATIDDSEMVEGLVLDHRAAKGAGGPTRMEGAKVALIQFQVGRVSASLCGVGCCGRQLRLRWGGRPCARLLRPGCALTVLLAGRPSRRHASGAAFHFRQVSPPKTDIENNVIISDYAQMDRILKVELLAGWWRGLGV